ncbi:MAG: hypothetical protein NTZ81_04250, partial [Actinobacteria bacterium]|nr:hypothetical protein [Actinomycetota bacterium]
IVDLPNGNGRKVKVAVICGNDKLSEAKSSGAEIAGSEDLINEINLGKINFGRVVGIANNAEVLLTVVAATSTPGSVGVAGETS